MKNLFSSILDLFFPPLCIVCSNRLLDGEPFICIACIAQLPKTNYHRHDSNRLEEFFAGRIPFQRIATYGYFVQEGSIQKIIHELKYKNHPEVGEYIGELYGADLSGSSFISNIDYLVPVPLHPKREKKRGYNQSYEIAKGLAKQIHIPIDCTTLIRTKNNSSQIKNARFDRWKNVEGIFSLTNSKTFVGKHLLLIDDVITTGSTLESCAKEILKCKDAKISLLAIGAAT